MENKNYNPNTNPDPDTPRNPKTYEPEKSNAGWVIFGVIALAVVLGIAYYNHNDNSDLSNISPAAGLGYEGNDPVPQRDRDNR